MTTILRMLSTLDGFDAAGGLANHGHREFEFERSLRDFCIAWGSRNPDRRTALDSPFPVLWHRLGAEASRIGAVRLGALTDRLDRLSAVGDDPASIKATMSALRHELDRITAELRVILDDL